MLIVVSQSGGFAGGEPVELHRVRTETLSESARRRIEVALGALREAVEAAGAPPVGADLFQYEIVTETGGVRDRLTVVDDMNPESPVTGRLQDFLDALAG